MELTCTRCRDALPEYAAGALSAADSDAITSHLADCPACRHELAQWRAMVEMTRMAEALSPTGKSATIWSAIQAQISSESPVVLGDRVMEFDDHHADIDLVESRPVPTRIERGPRRRATVMATIAAILLVALGAAVFALHPQQHRSAGGQTPHKTTATSTSAISVSSIASASILSANDIWAVDGFNHILHFTGTQWSLVPISLGPNVELKTISMDSADDGWAVGVSGANDSATASPVLVHFTNGQWKQVPFTYPGLDLTRVQMISPNSGWALGTSDSQYSILFHYTHGNWTHVAFTPPVPPSPSLASTTGQRGAPLSSTLPMSSIPPSQPGIDQIHMLSDSEGWAIGQYQNQSNVWHYVNGQWTVEQHVAMASASQFLSIGVNASNDVWVLALNVHASGVTFLHFNGQMWTTVPVNAIVSQFLGDANWIPITEDARGNQTQDVTGMLHNQNGHWVKTSLPGTFDKIISVAQQPDGNTLALAVTADTAKILRFANGAWSIVH